MAKISRDDFWSRTNLQEDTTFELKKAAGRDGKGELPQSFFETYSAMANTYGGFVMLGLVEAKEGSFDVYGIENPERVIKNLWDLLNDPTKVSVNLLTNKHVQILKLADRKVIQIEIPRARREHRPVYIGPNPLTGTYRRNFEGDYKCDTSTIKRMMAEQVDPEPDSKMLKGFSINDLEKTTFQAYRRQFLLTKPEHPWVSLSDEDFLRSIGGSTTDRDTGDTGLTIAGILMFGKLPSILDALPNYVLDYQEKPAAKADTRWIDRVTTDGSWSGNLFDYYRLTIAKLTANLKVPFRLEGDRRVDTSPVHEAIREAFINTLIHADYSARSSVLAVRRPDFIGFRNPGTMRISIDDALAGGNSDCRNRKLQKMFQLVGLGEQAGSGIPKIWRTWGHENWRVPELEERLEPDQTLLVMRMVSLFPTETLELLDGRFGNQRLAELNNTQRLALATVAIEGEVSHSRLKAMSTDHPSDISKSLSGLVRDGYLESSGAARGTTYFFPGESPASLGSEHMVSSSEHLGVTSEHLGIASEHTELLRIAEVVRLNKRSTVKVVRKVIMELCEIRPFTLRELAEILGREQQSLRVHHLNKMVKTGQLSYLYSDQPSHPKQAYTMDSRSSR